MSIASVVPWRGWKPKWVGYREGSMRRGRRRCIMCMYDWEVGDKRAMALGMTSAHFRCAWVEKVFHLAGATLAGQLSQPAELFLREMRPSDASPISKEMVEPAEEGREGGRGRVEEVEGCSV
eukprot:361562-Chlamydomonas_euryale.AAC.5